MGESVEQTRKTEKKKSIMKKDNKEINNNVHHKLEPHSLELILLEHGRLALGLGLAAGRGALTASAGRRRCFVVVVVGSGSRRLGL